MPYGLGLAPWDTLLTDAELENFFQQIAVINRARWHCLVLSCIWHDAGRVRSLMMANGYSDCHVIVGYKPMQNVPGLEFINAVEIMVVGYKGGVKQCRLTFADMNPILKVTVPVGVLNINGVMLVNMC